MWLMKSLLRLWCINQRRAGQDGQRDFFADYLCINVNNSTAGSGWSYGGENFYDENPRLTCYK